MLRLFTLYNNGSGSKFIDYDEDGIKDEKDPYPLEGKVEKKSFNVADIGQQIYKGKEIRPKVDVTNEAGEVLAEGKDYSVSYKNNSKPGTAKVIVTGIGDYEGTKEVSFEIICSHDFGEWITVKEPTEQEEGLQERICNICGVTEEETISKIDEITLSTEKYTYNGKVKIGWKNLKNETGYQISQSTKKNGTKIVSTYKTTKGNSKIVKAKKNKTYYYKVRVYKVDGCHTIYGNWSEVRTYKMK